MTKRPDTLQQRRGWMHCLRSGEKDNLAHLDPSYNHITAGGTAMSLDRMWQSQRVGFLWRSERWTSQ